MLQLPSILIKDTLLYQPFPKADFLTAHPCALYNAALLLTGLFCPLVKLPSAVYELS